MTKPLSVKADYLLDITGDRCPMTFVKTRLTLDKMQAGERLEVRLKGAGPLSNVPRSAKELGHIVSEPKNLEDNIYFLVIEKK
jgi:tRNA 2-thiouridine synthesizing protein A